MIKLGVEGNGEYRILEKKGCTDTHGFTQNDL